MDDLPKAKKLVLFFEHYTLFCERKKGKVSRAQSVLRRLNAMRYALSYPQETTHTITIIIDHGRLYIRHYTLQVVKSDLEVRLGLN